ncbi:unnamed protein product [Rotaria sordida]|uniref:F-box domain-containing protein n=1 Tax=Rotaria sordida TaxID=392033 RepID=A0A814RPN5_9BILA|nr:unnamed protein product [Rotaria sordida]CAF1360403.1 unnamed protein product [Rotaria sordida]
MERIKRQKTDIIENYYNENKKQKLQDQNNNKNKLLFENLSNEIIYEIFDYLGIYYAYHRFFNLNQRFNNFFINSNLHIQIDISSMSKLNFEQYYKDIILPNKHRINYLRLSNVFTVDIIFSPPRLISKFFQLETLVFDNINTRYLNNILHHLIILPELHSLTINLTDYIQNSTLFYLQLFHLPKLKYCKIQFESKDEQQLLPRCINEFSSIEYFIIKNCFQFQLLNNFLSYLPRICHLSIDYLNGIDFKDIELYPLPLKYLKYVSLELDLVYFNRFEQLIKNFFYHIEILRFTSKYDSRYLNAEIWEKLIISYMPYLRVFDVNHDGSIQHNLSRYHNWIDQFNSSFWTKKQWFFTHQHDWQDTIGSGIFYSTNPYRRKDYTFIWELNKKFCSDYKQTNFSSVKHVRVSNLVESNTSTNYFPNATQLTIKHDLETLPHSISIILNRIVPLAKLTKLIFIYSYDFPFEQSIELLGFTPNLHTLKYDVIIFNETNSKLIQQNNIFQYVSKINKIKNLEIHQSSTLEEIKMIVNLFPQLEYFKTKMIRKEIELIIRFLLSKNNHQIYHLYYLCILEIPKIYLKKLNMLIKLENLLDDYSIKLINRDLYLWW